MRESIFYQLDVFTETAFTGNPLAVFPDGEGLSDSEMQSIAREMNLSETVFVLPSDKALKRLRIFTPRQELPLAGHPVVGTWNLLAQLGITPHIENGTVELEQELKLGVLPVEITFRENNPFKVTMTQGKFEIGSQITGDKEIESLAQSLGLKVSDLDFSADLPIQTASTGIKSLNVPVKSLEVLARLRINSSYLSEIYLSQGAIGCYCFTFVSQEKTSPMHARFFAPNDGIPEDPATGSAAGALAGYLVHHGAKSSRDDTTKLIIEQGDFMQRPSRIFAEVTGEKGNVERVKIGGSSVVIAKGEVFF